MARIAQIADSLKLHETFTHQDIIAEQFRICIFQIAQSFFIDLLVLGKIMKHRDNIHAALIIGSLRFPSYQHT